ncbi:TadA family conjugal transfer-associated ATPase [Actinopolymorpha singaporensis]|uniref:Pilus assembly protein CpaF n=1 Tax=Actinopolymorpha singaporensis TaxID=117157 RepID=A0A1H1Q251_9ACTN|nr:TadA family conjugal transfer-associated ATPase [Actinopolymorpha singaporensis]SDS17423.1 pilus assembly protein CpaF [Actinopolymorpha singaporensis]
MTGAATAATVDQGLLDRVRQVLAQQAVDPTPARVAAALGAEGRILGDAAVLRIVETLRRELAGAGPLEALLADPAVTDVLVQGPRQVWVDRGAGLEPTDVAFDDEAAVRRLAQRLAGGAGRRLDDATPFVDARLADGTRFHAVLAPVSTRGTCISLRVPRRRAFAVDELVAEGSVPVEGAQLLGRLVKARLAFLVSGGTGVGKTTLLAALLSLVPASDRLVLVEDSGELAPDHPNVVALEARPANLEGAGEITVRTLVRQALRMRPDRLVVGEVRGAEVVDLLAALNTGHEGGCGTLHANSAAEVPARIEALGVAAGLGRAAVHSQLAAAVDVDVHLVRGRDGRRRVGEICVFERQANGLVAAVSAVRFDADGEVRVGAGLPRLRRLLTRRDVGDRGGAR